MDEKGGRDKYRGVHSPFPRQAGRNHEIASRQDLLEMGAK
jgi:hypothetical protein